MKKLSKQYVKVLSQTEIILVIYYGLDMDDGKIYIVFDNKKDEGNAKLIR